MSVVGTQEGMGTPREVVMDSTSVATGIRNLNWDTEQGLKVNEQRVKMRGACNHESFTGVGAAL